MLTPIDIQNREIKSKMGGYDKKDVDDFLEEIRGSYEELYKENQSLKEKISSLSEGPVLQENGIHTPEGSGAC